jgi:hypothetical protein
VRPDVAFEQTGPRQPAQHVLIALPDIHQSAFEAHDRVQQVHRRMIAHQLRIERPWPGHVGRANQEHTSIFCSIL